MNNLCEISQTNIVIVNSGFETIHIKQFISNRFFFKVHKHIMNIVFYIRVTFSTQFDELDNY